MLGVLGDLGGIFEITMIVFGFFLFPMSEHSFILRAARLLYFGRTKEQLLLDNSRNPDKHEKLEKWMNTNKYTELKCSYLQSEISKHRIIKLTLVDNIKLFFANILQGICCDSCWSKK